MATPGKVWTRFTKNCNGRDLKLRIQELPHENFEDIFDFLFKYFVPDEPLHKASKVAQRAEALEEYKQVFTLMLDEMGYQVDACCLDDGEEQLQIVGLSIMMLEKRDVPCDDLETVKAMVNSEEIKTLLTLSKYMNDECEIFDKFEYASCYKGRGVAVHREYRGLGIAGELLSVRSLISKERGVPCTAAWMTPIGTQRAASKLGWDTICEVLYKDLGKKTGVEFDAKPPSTKLMIVEV